MTTTDHDHQADVDAARAIARRCRRLIAELAHWLPPSDEAPSDEAPPSGKATP